MGFKIITGKYETGTQEQQAGFKQLFGHENTQFKFDLYFHWYNIIHELGHCLLSMQNKRIDLVDEEMLVNAFAVGYWKHAGNSDNLKKLSSMLESILEIVPNPIPAGMEFTEFFRSIWGSEQLNTVAMYGFFQLSSVLEAMKLNKNFSNILDEMGLECGNLSAMKAYDREVTAENAESVLAVALENLRLFGNEIADIEIEFADNPEVQCANCYN